MRLTYATFGLLIVLSPLWVPLAIVGWLAFQVLSLVNRTLDRLSEWWWTR